MELKPNYAEVVCADGVTLSVQASRHHYCTPRNDEGPYTTVEVGFPSVRPPVSWKPYCEDWKDPTNTVYGCVPVALVAHFVKRHGGMTAGEMPAAPMEAFA